MAGKNRGGDCSEKFKKGIMVGRDLWRKVKAQAALEEKSVNEWVLEALREKLDSKTIV
jgi:predicted HicB family RNase H-like nuclease